MNQHYPLADDSYEQEYMKIKDQFSKQFQKFSTKPDKKLLNELQRDYDDAQSSALAIEQEINGYPQEQKLQKRQKLRKIREEIDKMKRQVQEAESQLLGGTALFGDSEGREGNSDLEGSQKKGAQKLSQQNYRLQEAKRVAYDIEGQSNNLGYEVARQNEQLSGMIRGNKEISTDLSASNQLLERIKKNIVKRKAVLYCVTLSLVICFVIILASYIC